VIVALATAETAVVPTVKVAELTPAGTVTLVGTVALALLDVRLTAMPPVGAGPFRLTVPVDDVPPMTEAGERETPVSAGGVMVKVAVWLTPLNVPVIVTDVDDATAVVFTLNVAVVAPAATVTDAGTVALAFPEPKVTVAPPVPAGPERVTVPVDGLPPMTDVGLRVTLRRLAGLMVRVAVRLAEANVAVIVALADVATAVVVIVKVAVVAPAATVTEVGSVAFAVLDARETAIPPVGAAPLRVTVPVDGLPPMTVDGESVSPVSTGGFIVSVAVFEVPARVAVIVTEAELETAVVLIGNVAELDPAVTVTLVGSVALVLLEVRLTVIPPVPAGPLRLTVPVEALPPMTEVGETDTLLSTGVLMVRVAVAVFVPWVPVIVAEVVEVTAVVLIVKVTEVAPAATVTLAGNVAFDELEVRLTEVPPGPAGPFRVAVPVEELPPVTDVGETEIAVSAAGVIVSVAV
jgi:hypothetical protein